MKKKSFFIVPVSLFLILSVNINDKNTPDNKTLFYEEEKGSFSSFEIHNDFVTDSSFRISNISDRNENKVGFITITPDKKSSIITVRFDITEPGWVMLQSQLTVEENYGYIPGIDNSVDIDRDNYIMRHGDGVTFYEYLIPFDLNKPALISADAIIDRCPADWMAFNTVLPSGYSEAHFEQSDYSYFSIDLDHNSDGELDDFDYRGWCLSIKPVTKMPVSYPVRFISTFDPDLKTIKLSNEKFLIANPDGIKAVNWILNQKFGGNETDSESGRFDFRDVQAAILKLIDERSYSRLRTDDNHVDYIVNEALKHKDYIPGCGDLAGVILIPVNSEGNSNYYQPALISYPVPCNCGN